MEGKAKNLSAIASQLKKRALHIFADATKEGGAQGAMINDYRGALMDIFMNKVLMMKGRIALRGMRFYARHGVFEQEAQVGGYYTVDVCFALPSLAPTETDELADTVNYAEVYDCVRAEMDRPSRLIEHVAGRILRALRAYRSDLSVAVTKHHPPLGGEVADAMVTLYDVSSM